MMSEERFRRVFLILLVVAISAAFLAMIRMFLLTILLAAIFSGVARPVYLKLERWFRGHRALASVATILLLLVLVVAPLIGVVGVVAGEAVRVSRDVRPWIEAALEEPSLIEAAIRRYPFLQAIEPFREEIITRGGELVGAAGTFFANALSVVTTGTVLFLFHLFILLYSMFFFLIDGPRMLESMMEYLPLGDSDKERMLGKFISVTRATLKGTILIGFTQGALAGLAFWVVGIEGAVFWTSLMVVLSIIPAGIGGALVWVPAVILLLSQGAIWQGIGLGLFCAIVVGAVDNVLRPRLVGRDTRMHDLLILFSTLGGIVVFGVSGFIVGPILAALFVTVWDMFGTAFRNVLPHRPSPPPAV